MLRKMRSDFKKYSWTLWLVIIAFLIGFSFTDPFRTGKGEETDLFKIAGITVTGDAYYSEVLKTLEYYSKQLNTKINQSLITQLRLPEQVLQRLINAAVLRKEAKALNVSVSDEELSDKIKDYSIVKEDEKKGPVRVFLFREYGDANGRFIGLKRYEELLAMNRIKVKEFEADKKDEIIGEKFMQLVTGPLVIDNETLKEKYKLENDNVSLDFIAIQPDRIKQTIEVNDEEIKEFYENNKEDFKTREKRKGSAIVFKFEDFKKDVVIDDSKLFNYYRENKDSFLIPGKTKVSRIFLKYDEKNRDEILDKAEQLQKELTPENFAQKAGEFSQDEKTAQGGDYGYQGWQSFSEQEKTIIEGLEEKGISTVIDTQKGGFSIVFISEKVDKQQESFDKVKGGIRDNFEKEQLNKIVRNKLGKIYAKLKNEKDIKSKSEELGVAVIDTGALSNNDPIKDVDEGGFISRTLFSLKEGEVSTQIEFMTGMAVVQLTRVIKPEIELLENVKDKVKNKVEMAKKIELLEKDSQEIAGKLNTLKDEKEIEKYLKDNNLNVTSFEYKRGKRLSFLPEKEGLDEILFSLEEGRYSSPIKFTNQVVVIKAKSKKITDENDFEKDKADFYNKELGNLKINFFTSYIDNARDKYKIEFFNEKLFTQIKDQIMAKFRE